MRYKMALTALWLITCLALPAANLSDKVEKQNQQKIERFKATTGFIGSIEPIEDNRIFLRMDGTFNLPEPVDTVIFKSNCQIIRDYITNIYKIKRAEFELRIPSGRKIGVLNYPPSEGGDYIVSYQQYINGFPINFYHCSIMIDSYTYSKLSLTDRKIDGSLQIRYSPLSKLYTITNWLLLDKIALPKPKITKEQAARIAMNEIRKLRKQNPTLFPRDLPDSKIPLKPRNYCLRVYPTIPYTYKYVYSLFFDVNDGWCGYDVDGLTGKISKIVPID